MAVSELDRQAWAARIRAHFEPELRDIAEAVAAALVEAVGPRIKQLRPETPMAEVLRWLKEERAGAGSLDWVELLMVIEEVVPSEVTDAFAETLEQRTFREYVEHLHANRRRV